MRVCLGDLELDAAPGTTVSELVAFARGRGVELPERPWCGPVRLAPAHPAGLSPLVAFARLTPARGPDARPHLGVHLACVGGPDAGAVATLAEGLTIGRAEDCELRLTDPAVSAVHTRIARGRIRDAGSRNGVRVRGRRVRRRTTLRPGDVVSAGDTVMVVCDPAAPPAEAPSRLAPLGIASSAVASLSMLAFAAATGHWLLALAALAVPASAGLFAVTKSRKRPPPPVIDASATLGLRGLPEGPIAVRGPRGLVRAVTLVTGRPHPSARQWEPWMENLPPATREVAWLEPREEAPSWALVTVESHAGSGRGAAVSVSADGVTTEGPLPLVSAANAEAVTRRLASRADSSALLSEVRWAELPKGDGELSVRLGMGAGGPVTLDLVADGPHVLVAGTTGSGKSEALRTIICSLAHDHSPRHVAFALIDFKGGAGLGACASLPHVGSVLTDLEPHLARRCLLALAAELTDRKRAAAAAGASTFAEWKNDRPPRLVVVVDEFQEIAAADRDFLPELARLAAQGRSLGIHLVLATQRPAGAVGAEIRANISATLALRTASESESRDLIGGPEAARIAPALPGRGVLARAGALEEVQVAVALSDPPPRIRVLGEPVPPGRSLLATAAALHEGAAKPLWLPELPAFIAPSTGRGFSLGVADMTAARTREPLAWDPASGPLVITGPPRSGRTAALRAVGAISRAARLSPVWLPADPRLAVRTLALVPDLPGAILLIDDAARTLAAATTADAEAADLLGAAMSRVPLAIVVPPAWAHHRLIASPGLRLVLAGLTNADDAAWDVPRELRGLPSLPGRVRAHDAHVWREAQLALPGTWSPRSLTRPLPLVAGGALPARALGVGGDAAQPVVLPALPAAVVGPPGDERDAVARRVAIATGTRPDVAESPFALGGPGRQSPRVVVVVRPTARSLREAARDAPRGLLEPAHVPLRAVVLVDGAATAVQVLAA